MHAAKAGVLLLADYAQRLHCQCRNFIVPMDLEFFMPAEKIPHALKVLDVDGDGKISLTDMRDAVIQVHSGCRRSHVNGK